MRPVLFELPWGTPANGYGTMILLVVLLTPALVWWDARSRGIADAARASFVVDFYLVMVVGAAVGGRLVHVLTNPRMVLDDPARIVGTGSTGFVFFGSLLAAVAGLWWIARKYGTSFAIVLDLMATWAPLGHAMGRTGCFLAGCCYGAPYNGPLSVAFPPGAVAFADPNIPHVAGHTTALHATQLYEVAGLLGLFAVQLTLRLRRGPEPPWRAISRYALGYGVVRFVTELTRGDIARGFAFEVRLPAVSTALGMPADHVLVLSTSQAIAIALVGFGIWGLRRAREPR